MKTNGKVTIVNIIDLIFVSPIFDSIETKLYLVIISPLFN